MTVKQNRRPVFATATLLAAALWAMPALPAMGQQQVQNGNAHDANPQVGSGGANRAENQVDYSQRNSVLLGQSGGGRSFQGDLGYSDPRAFQGGLGSDALFSFRRDSILSAPQAAGLNRGTFGSNVVVTRPTTQLLGYGGVPTLGISSNTVYDARSGVVSFQQSNGGNVRIQGVRNLADLGGTAGTVGFVQTPQGGVAQVQLSLLEGIRYNPLDAQNQQTSQDASATQANPLNFNPRDNGDADQAQREDEPLQGFKPDGSLDLRIDNRFDAIDSEDRETEDPAFAMMQNNQGRLAPSMIIGNGFQGEMRSQATDQPPRSLEEQVSLLRDQMLGRAPDATNPDQLPSDPYQELLARIRGDSEEGVEVEEQPRAPWTLDVLEDPDEEEMDLVTTAREDAMRRALGMVDEDGNVDRSVPLPELDDDSPLAGLLDELDYDLPRLSTLSGEDRTQRHNELLAKAEQEMAAQRYLTAETLYRQVLRESNDNPLAKAGLVHSQLGAGMIRSAAYNLRGLFTDHPELVALRYERELLPSAERLEWLQGELMDMIAEDQHSAEPGLILAYVGYQLETPSVIQYGLGVSTRRTPRDPLMPILDRIWMEREEE